MAYPWSAGDTLSAADLNSFFSKLVTTVASVSTSVTIAADTTDIYIITAQAGSCLFNNPSGSVASGKALMIRIKDNGTARALTGPVARGDDPVVKRHLDALDGWDERIAAIYRELGKVALDLSRAQGTADAEALARLEKLLLGQP